MTREQEYYVNDQCNQFDGAPIEVMALTTGDEGPVLVTLPSGARFVVDVDGEPAVLNPHIKILED